MKKIIFCLLFAHLAAFGDVYKWTDSNGQVHFGNIPNNAAAESVEIKSQKIGTVAPTQTIDMVAEKPVYVKTKTPDKSAAKGDSPVCTFAKGKLQQKELKLAQLKRRGYKQYERAEADDEIETWKLKVKQYCN